MSAVFRYGYIQEYRNGYMHRPEHREYVKKSRVCGQNKDMKYTKHIQNQASYGERKTGNVPIPV